MKTMRARLPGKVIAPMTLPFSVNEPAESGTSRAARRITTRPPTPASRIPTTSPASPPRVMSRRTSSPGEATP
jgi:hypothetical protein